MDEDEPMPYADIDPWTFRVDFNYLIIEYGIEKDNIHNLIEKYNIFIKNNEKINISKYLGNVLYFNYQTDAENFLNDIIIPQEIIFKLVGKKNV